MQKMFDLVIVAKKNFLGLAFFLVVAIITNPSTLRLQNYIFFFNWQNIFAFNVV